MKKTLFAFCMSIMGVAQAFDATIPVVHLPDYFNEATREQFLQSVEKAAVEVGFFALTGTDVDVELLDEAYDQVAKFFAQDIDAKMALFAKDGLRGYVPGESAKGEARVDCKEFYHIGREVSNNVLPNVWPETPARFESSLKNLVVALDECKDTIAEIFGTIVHHDIKELTQKGNCLFRAIHYPKNPPKNSIWAGAHTDINLFTILPRSTARGLQVMNKAGEWRDVIIPDGAFVINCGDMLENLTNGYFTSSFHRVVDPGLGQERYSIVFFVHPKGDDNMAPLPHMIEKTGSVRKYANLLHDELFFERLIDLGVATKESMKWFVETGAIEKLREVERFSPKAEETLRASGFEI
jgi:isopenicillin N synthase-like dioxygenase